MSKIQILKNKNILKNIIKEEKLKITQNNENKIKSNENKKIYTSDLSFF